MYQFDYWAFCFTLIPQNCSDVRVISNIPAISGFHSPGRTKASEYTQIASAPLDSIYWTGFNEDHVAH